MFLVLTYVFVMFGVTTSAVMAGGRHERIFGLMVLALAMGAQINQYAFHGGLVPAVVMLTMDLAFLAGVIWLWRRERARWLGLQVGLQSLGVPLDFAMGVHVGPWDAGQWAVWWATSVLLYLQLAILAWAVLRRHFGPPYPVPRKLQPARAG